MDFNAGLSSAKELVDLHPSAVETIDSTILELARKDAVWHEVNLHLTRK